jgi:hypothetical protein
VSRVVSKMLQSGGSKTLTLHESRELFDGLIVDFGGKYPLTALRTDSGLVNNPRFENGIIKIQAGNEEQLTKLEKDAVAIF